MLDRLAIRGELQVHRDQIAAPRIAAAKLNIGIRHPPLVSRMLEMVKYLFDILLSIHSRSFPLTNKRNDTKPRPPPPSRRYENPSFTGIPPIISAAERLRLVGARHEPCDSYPALGPR